MVVWVSPASRSCSSAASAAGLPPPRLAHSRIAAWLSDAVIAARRFACSLGPAPRAMTAIAIGTLLVDHAIPVWIAPTRSTLWSGPTPEMARPSRPPSDAVSRAKLARSALERIRRTSPGRDRLGEGTAPGEDSVASAAGGGGGGGGGAGGG